MNMDDINTTVDEVLNQLEDNGTYFPYVKRVVFNNPATIIEFSDGTKSVVKASAGDKFDKEHGVIYAIIKRLYGTLDAKGVAQGDGLSTKLPKLIKEAWDQPYEMKLQKKLKEKARLQNIELQKAEHLAAKERKIQRLATEIEHYLEALEYLKANGRHVDDATRLINEMKCAKTVAAADKCDKCDHVDPEDKIYGNCYKRPDKPFSQFTQEEKREYWKASKKGWL